MHDGTSAIFEAIDAANGHQPSIAEPPVAQAGAICWRSPSGVFSREAEILLVVGNGSGQWGIPKGHIEAGETSWQAALREAGEEAGVIGQVQKISVGRYSHYKSRSGLLCEVTLHLVKVQGQLSEYPDRNLRMSRWLTLPSAVEIVGSKALAEVLDGLCL